MEKLWIEYKETVIQGAEETCGHKTICGPSKRTAWWNDEVKQKVKEKKVAWKKYLATKRNEDREDYRTKCQKAKEEVQKSKQRQWEMFGEKLEDNFKENQKLFWGAVKRCRRGNQCPTRHVKNNQGVLIKDDEKILEVWKEYFQSLHNQINNSHMADNGNTEMNGNSDNDSNDELTENQEEDYEITMGELIKAKKKIKIGKAPGADGIYPEMIVHQGMEGDRLLLKVCQVAFKMKMVPEDWRKSIIIPIHKGGASTQCENYRGISLLSVPGKLYARILENRLRSIVEDKLLDHQSGFRPGRSVQDHIYTLRKISETTHRYNSEAHLCFVDLQKAFDSVKRDELWEALKKHNVDTELIKAIKSFYVNPESRVQIGGKTSSSFKIDIGVRQGCILSPLLFITLMNLVAKNCKDIRPFNVGMWKLRPVKLSMLLFADDLVVFGRTQQDLEHNMNVLNRELKIKGLKINPQKTKTMILNRETKRHEIKLDGEIMEQVDVYKYLGVMIKSNGSLKEEINQRIGKATKVYGQLGGCFINKKELTTKTKMSIFNSIYCPTLSYGSESWTLDSRDKSRLQAAEMKFLRRSVGKTKRDRIRNTRIREEVKTESLEIKIERNQLRWYGHLNRMSENRIPKQILECKQTGKLPRGRPRKMWEEVITEIVEKRGCKLVEARRKTLDRDQWRKFCQSKA